MHRSLLGNQQILSYLWCTSTQDQASPQHKVRIQHIWFSLYLHVFMSTFCTNLCWITASDTLKAEFLIYTRNYPKWSNATLCQIAVFLNALHLKVQPLLLVLAVAWSSFTLCRSDKTLQDIVYKLVPGLFKSKIMTVSHVFWLILHALPPFLFYSNSSTAFTPLKWNVENRKLRLHQQMCP